MHWNWSIFAGALGFAAARAAMFEYQLWKKRRTSIPMDWNPKAKAYEADFRLNRLERWGRIGAWGLYGAICVIGYNVVVNDWLI